MLPILAAAIVMTAAPAPAPTGDINAAIWPAIWNDLELNGLIGNGNHLAWLWYNASQQDAQPIPLHIQALDCKADAAGYRCAFTLLRDGGPRAYAGETAPDRIACTAQFVRKDDGWAVKHLPPRHGGHSRTDMRCDAAPAAGED